MSGTVYTAGCTIVPVGASKNHQLPSHLYSPCRKKQLIRLYDYLKAYCLKNVGFIIGGLMVYASPPKVQQVRLPANPDYGNRSIDGQYSVKTANEPISSVQIDSIILFFDEESGGIKTL